MTFSSLASPTRPANTVRFERYHCFDFEEFKWAEWIKARFEYWTDTAEDGRKNPKNAAFQRYFAEQSPGRQVIIITTTMIEPFTYLLHSHYYILIECTLYSHCIPIKFLLYYRRRCSTTSWSRSR